MFFFPVFYSKISHISFPRSLQIIVFFPIDCSWIHHTHTWPCAHVSKYNLLSHSYIHTYNIHNLVIYKIYTIKVYVFFRIYYLTLVNQLVIFNKTLLSNQTMGYIWPAFMLCFTYV